MKLTLKYTNLIKRYNFAIISVVILIISSATIYCISANSHYIYPKALVMADTICNKDPKRAEQLLKKFQASNREMDSNTEWYYRFLTVKSDIKQYKEPKNDKEIINILKHYEKEDDQKILTQVYYYTGCTYHILGDAPKAIDYFQKGLAILAKGKDTEELRALYYYMLGGVLTYQHLDKEALGLFRKALDIHERLNDKKRISDDCYVIAWSYKALGIYAKSIQYLNIAREIAVSNKQEETVSNIDAQIADLYYLGKKYTEATKYIERALTNTDNSNKSATYSIAAEIYQATGKTEAAKYYYEKVMKTGNIFSKQNAYKFLADYYGKNKNIEEENRYCKMYCAATDSILRINAAEYSAKANAAFNYKSIEAENDELKDDIKAKDFIVLISVLIIFASVCYYAIYRWKAIKRINNIRTYLEARQALNAEDINRREKELALLKERLKESNDNNEDLKIRYKIKERQVYLLMQQNNLLRNVSITQADLLKETIIYKKLYCLTNNHKGIPEDSDLWKELEETLYDIYPRLKMGLSKFSKMRLQAFHVCLLLKAGFDTNQISILTCKTAEAISSTKRRLYKNNIGQKGKPRDWDDIIKEL